MSDTPTGEAITAAVNPGAGDPQKSVIITFEHPIQRGEAPPVERITLRKPKAGEMRGLKISELINSDVDSLITLVPRISQPFITAAEVGQLEAEDIAELAGAIFGFFMPKSARDQIAQMTGA